MWGGNGHRSRGKVSYAIEIKLQSELECLKIMLTVISRTMAKKVTQNLYQEK